MGIKNSSQTRVAPVFKRIVQSHKGPWLDRLLTLPQRFDGLPRAMPSAVGAVFQTAWWPKEERLHPPHKLLQWMLENPRKLDPPRELGGQSTAEKRKLLLAGDPGIQQEGSRLLSAAAVTRPWPNEGFVLEGPTSVDAFFRTRKAVVVVEGKRIENGPTTKTDWMPVRHQMLRTLDCAIDTFPGYEIWGLFIVEGDLPKTVDVPERWKGFSNDTTNPMVLEESLPHRSAQERLAVAHSYVGVTTWQAVCDQFQIDFSSLPDECEERPLSRAEVALEAQNARRTNPRPATERRPSCQRFHFS
jgi:hypothetical protein